MNKKEFEREFNKKQRMAQLSSLDANKNRAQSVSIGMSASGMTEITMRGEDGTFLFNVYQPVQVTEFIHQLAAGIGCHIHLQPRKDFGSWREWREPTEEDRLHLNGFPPFAGQIRGSEKIGLAPKEKNEITETENVATKKAVNKRSTKRTRTTAK
jgi:hypothetical protein